MQNTKQRSPSARQIPFLSPPSPHNKVRPSDLFPPFPTAGSVSRLPSSRLLLSFPPPHPSLVFLRRLFGQRGFMRRFSRTGCVLRAQLVSPQSCPTMIPLSRVIQDLIQMTSAGLGNSLSVFYCTLHRKSGSLRVRFPTTLFKLKVVFSVALGRYISFTAVSDLPTDGIGAQHLSKQPWGNHHLVPAFSTLRP